DVPVVVTIAPLVDPAQRRSRLGLEAAHEVRVARPALVFVEKDEKELRRVGGAEVRGMRALLECGELAPAQLVHDPARLLVAEIVPDQPLPHAEDRQRRPRQLVAERQRLQAGEQTVATEYGHEPWETGGR